MAKRGALRVFRTAIGFHDAYVAAPSQKAALAAWGSDHDLFARGQAELVTDPALTEAPLARPGEVIKRLRGSAEEQVAALGASPKKAKSAAKPVPPQPRPDRAPLDAAESRLDAAEKRFGREDAALRQREDKVRAERQALDASHRAERDALEREREEAAHTYQAALARWRG